MPDWWATRDALRDVLVESGKLQPPKRKFDLDEIRPGWLVYDRELELVGRFEGLLADYLIVRRSFGRFFLWQRLYIPETALGEAHEGSVILNVPRNWIGDMGWGRPPRTPPRDPPRRPPRRPPGPGGPPGAGPDEPQPRSTEAVGPDVSRRRT